MVWWARRCAVLCGTRPRLLRTRRTGVGPRTHLSSRRVRRLGARHLCVGTIRAMVVPSSRRIPEATVARLPVYQRILLELVRAGTTTVSSDQLAEMARVERVQGPQGPVVPGLVRDAGLGYEAQFLLTQIDRELGLHGDWPVAIVGLGNLGRALANSQGFTSPGFSGGRAVRRGAVAPRDRDRRRDSSITWTSSNGCRRPTHPRSVSSPRRRRPPRTWPTAWCRPGWGRC